MKGHIYESIIGPLTFLEKQGFLTEICFGESSKKYQKEETPLLKESFKQMQEYLEGKRQSFSLPYKHEGSLFQKKVLEALISIPYGKTRSYEQIAQEIGNPKAARAVGMACHRNSLPILIPCHRVMGKQGNLVGYAGGISVKEFLLQLEKK